MNHSGPDWILVGLLIFISIWAALATLRTRALEKRRQRRPRRLVITYGAGYEEQQDG